jgi:FlaA1/EpsC-like NDP-sugar epimerase
MQSSKARQIFIFLTIDIAIVAFSAIVPLALRFGIFDITTEGYFDIVIRCLPFDICIALATMAFFKLYTRVWVFAGFPELLDVLKASVLIEAAYIMYHVMFSVHLPRSYYPIQWVFLLILLGASRVSARFYRQIMKRNRSGDVIGIMVVGAGDAGSILLDEINNLTSGQRILCFVDDNKNKVGKYIGGVLIAGSRYDIPVLTKKFNIEEIVIAMPSASPKDIREIVSISESTEASLKIFHKIYKPSSGFAEGNIRDLNYEDLLGRNVVEVKNEKLAAFLYGKTVMVTGAGGSIGSELCRQIASNRPRRLVMVDIYENSLYDVSEELKRHFPAADVISLVASVRDEKRLMTIFEQYRPGIIYHAAAHKHVPLMEDSPCEAVKNNCGGTLALARLADRYGVEDFILISTDKAVRPTNVMGATKRICEMVVQAIGRGSNTRFVSVRFGNVLGSNGSVIPLFLKQIEEGGPVTVTHRDITRFFMTISEAVSLVLQAGMLNGNNELFLLDMGEPVRIYDLAVNLIKLKGLEPDKDIKIEFTGLRPGEKLYEELLIAEEESESTYNDLIFVGKTVDIEEDIFMQKLDDLLRAADGNSEEIKDEITKVCDTYKRSEQIYENAVRNVTQNVISLAGR